jgi:hypothetical protein
MQKAPATKAIEKVTRHSSYDITTPDLICKFIDLFIYGRMRGSTELKHRLESYTRVKFESFK